jgi:hypothetical protein
MEIKDISVRDLDIPDVRITETINYSQPVIPYAPPVVVEIGVPIVNIPGCVESNENNSGKNNNLFQDDPRGNKVYCDSGVPSYDPINFEPEQILPTMSAPIPNDKPDTPVPEIPESPQVKPPVATAQVECPTAVQQAQEPVGTYVNGFRERVTGYELIDQTCVQITEEVPLPRQIVEGLPSGGQVVQVGGVAVIATTSALLAKPLADLLLKAVKPAVKKVLKKVASIRGKKPPVLSVGERRAEQRQMNHAVKALRSVFPRKKKKG